MKPELTVVESVAASARDRLLAAGRQALAASGSFSVALSGGSTPKALYRLLQPGDLPWAQVQLFFGDERAVPIDDPRSNYHMTQEAMLDRIAEARAHFLDDPAAYERLLVATLGPRCEFDLMLLGLGVGGHTASLFPGSPALAERDRKVVQAPGVEPAPIRYTVTPPVIWAARRVLVLVSGADKADLVRDAWQRPADYPIGLTWQCEGEVEWLLDPAAAARVGDRP